MGGTKTSKFHDSSFVDPWGPLIMDLDISRYFEKCKENMGTFLKNIIYRNLKSRKPYVLSIVEKTGTRDDEDPGNKLSQTMDMGSISS